MGIVLMGRAMLSKSLIQFSVDRQGCVPSLLFDLNPNYCGGTTDNGDLLKSSHASTAVHCSDPTRSRPLSTHDFAEDSWTLTGKSGSVTYGVTAPFSWVLVHTRFFFFFNPDETF